MLYAIKGNKQLKIDEAEKTTYLNMGYDIAEVNGGQLDVIAVSPSKSVPYAEYVKLQEENGALRRDNAALKEDIAALKEQLAETGKKKVDK